MSVHGFGQHEFDLVGVAERLKVVDQIPLSLYCAHPQIPVSMSSDPVTSVVMVSGAVDLLFHNDTSESVR
jgi:hypothetical protein